MSRLSCPHCGAELPPVGDAFCPECRESLAEGDVGLGATAGDPTPSWVPSPSDRVDGPGRALVAVGAVNLLIGFLLALDGFTGLIQGRLEVRLGVGGIVVVLFALVVIVGGLELLWLRSRAWAVAGCAAAMIPGLSPCCLGLPIGLLALVTAFSADVRQHFADRQ